jgi:hypothetical protein
MNSENAIAAPDRKGLGVNDLQVFWPKNAALFPVKKKRSR